MDKGEFTTAEVMAFCGLSASNLQYLTVNGKINGNIRFGVYGIKTLSDYVGYLKAKLESKTTEGTTPEKRFRHYRAVQAKLRAEEMAGQLVDVEKVETAVSAMAGRAIARLAAIPDASCALLRELLGEDHEDVLAEARKLLDDAVRDACSELSHLDPDALAGISPEIAEDEEGGEDDGTEAEVEAP